MTCSNPSFANLVTIMLINTLSQSKNLFNHYSNFYKLRTTASRLEPSPAVNHYRFNIFFLYKDTIKYKFTDPNSMSCSKPSEPVYYILVGFNNI